MIADNIQIKTKPEPTHEEAMTALKALWARIKAYEASGKITRSSSIVHEILSDDEAKELERVIQNPTA